jgi:hypothetical protein
MKSATVEAIRTAALNPVKKNSGDEQSTKNV